MQLIILGMHRSGTSVLARLLNMMGAYFGPEGINTAANKENPKGFWERKDLRALNDNLLFSQNCDWNLVNNFNVDKLDVNAIEEFEHEASRIITALDAHRPWFIKEPRLCLTFPLLKSILELPVCLFIYRSPLEVAKSLKTRNNISIETGIALWEKYNLSALSSSSDLPRIFINHQDLMLEPVQTTEYIFDSLESLNVQGLRCPKDEEITAFIDQSLYRARADSIEKKEALSADQINLFNLLEQNDSHLLKSPAPLSKISEVVLSGYEKYVALENTLSTLKHSHESEISELKKKHNKELSELKIKHSKVTTELNIRLEKEVSDFDNRRKNELSELDSRRKNELSELDSRRKNELSELDSRRKNELSELDSRRKNELSELDSKRKNELLELVSNHEDEITKIKQRLFSELEKISSESRLLKVSNRSFKNNISDLNSALKIERQELQRYRNEIKLLRKMLSKLITSSNGLVASNRWRLGNAIFELAHKTLLRKQPELATSSIREVQLDYVKWRDDFYREEELAQKKCLSHNNHDMSHNLYFDKYGSPFPSIDIIVCVHNALNDVKACLASILENTNRDYHLIVVDDGSDDETNSYLKTVTEDFENATLLRNSLAEGYTKAANRGLQASAADYVVCLNSDTIVPRLWIESLVECGESDNNIGIVGPLSNAASWQSVPKLYNETGDWAVNEIPTGYDVNQMAELIYVLSVKSFPRVPFVNGFCFAIKRKVIEKIGFLDEETFPKGYGEENDYCIRACNAGFSLAIADQAYVYHAKSKSYSHEKRVVLSKASNESLHIKHGQDTVEKKLASLKSSIDLELIRENVALHLDDVSSKQTSNPIKVRNQLNITFVLPVEGGSGGAHSVVQEVSGMRSLGVNARVATLSSYSPLYKKHYPALFSSGDAFIFFENPRDLLKEAKTCDLMIATLWSSLAIIEAVLLKLPQLRTGYYIQDYEPFFFVENTIKWKIAHDSYRRIPGSLLFAKTQWLCDTVENEHKTKVYRVRPSIDLSIYHPDAEAKQGYVAEVVISAMVRPTTPRRAAWKTLEILQNIKLQFGSKVNIIIFGCKPKKLDSLKIEQAPDLNLHFKFQNEGELTQNQVASLLQKSDIFVDFSDYQAFGRTGLEAMACGCAVIVPELGGSHEYAIHNHNALIVDTKSRELLTNELARLIEDKGLREQCQQRAIETASQYSIRRAVLSELSVFRQHLMMQNIKASRQKQTERS